MSPRRHGSTLVMILVVIMVTCVVIWAIQYSVSSSFRQVRLTAEWDEQYYRALGLLHQRISRWTASVSYLSQAPLREAATGSLAGEWDGVPYVFGWELGGPLGDGKHRLGAWVRFPGLRPAMTHYFELRVASPLILKPRHRTVTEVTILSGSSYVSPDPRS